MVSIVAAIETILCYIDLEIRYHNIIFFILQLTFKSGSLWMGFLNVVSPMYNLQLLLIKSIYRDEIPLNIRGFNVIIISSEIPRSLPLISLKIFQRLNTLKYLD